MSVGLPRGGGGGGLPLGYNTITVMGLAVRCEQPCRQVRSIVQAFKPHMLVVPLGESLPCHSSLAHLFLLGPDRA